MKYFSAILFVIFSLCSLEFVASRGVIQGCCDGTDATSLNITCEPCPVKNVTGVSMSNDTEKARAIEFPDSDGSKETITKTSNATGDGNADSEHVNRPMTESSIIRIYTNMSKVDAMPENITLNESIITRINTTTNKDDSKPDNMTMNQTNAMSKLPENVAMNESNDMSKVESKQDNMTTNESNAMNKNDSKPDNMRVDKSIIVSDIESKPGNMTMNQTDDMSKLPENVTMNESSDMSKVESKQVNMTMTESNGMNKNDSQPDNMTIVESNDISKVDSKPDNMTMAESNTTKIHMAMSPVDTKPDNMTMDNITKVESNLTAMNASTDNHNSTMDDMTVVEFNSTNSNATEFINTMRKANFTSENTTMDKLQDCDSNGTVSCLEHGCLLETEYCTGTFDCSNLNKSAICGESNITMRKSKKQELSPLPLGHNEISENELSSEKSNRINYEEPEEVNFINGSTAVKDHEGEAQATKESLKEAEPGKDGSYNLKIIIPVVVIAGLCLVVLIIWFVTKRSKKVDSYALQ